MRKIVFASAAVVLLAGCVAPPPAPPPAPGSLKFNGPGSSPVSIHIKCQDAAIRQCPRDTVYCRSYQRSFIEACMIENGVAADYIWLLTRN